MEVPLAPYPNSQSCSPIPHLREATLPAIPATSSYTLRRMHGEVSGGSLGVRGFISNVEGVDSEAAACLVYEGLQILKSEGVKRVHIVAEQGSALSQAGREAGLQPRHGESLFRCSLVDKRPPYPTAPLGSYTLRDGTVNDLITIGLKLGGVPELAFEQWEFPLIYSQLNKRDRFFKVIIHDDQIVGVSLGGSTGKNGTISHTWIADDHRRHGLGHVLSEASLHALYEGGAREIHLMTVAGNEAANRFWRRQGFTDAVSMEFLEIDL